MVHNSSSRIFFFTEERLPYSPILAPIEGIVISCSMHYVYIWHCHLFKSIQIPYKK